MVISILKYFIDKHYEVKSMEISHTQYDYQELAQKIETLEEEVFNDEYRGGDNYREDSEGLSEEKLRQEYSRLVTESFRMNDELREKDKQISRLIIELEATKKSDPVLETIKQL